VVEFTASEGECGGFPVLRLRGQLDSAEHDELDCLLTEFSAAKDSFILDLLEVSYMESRAIGVLLKLHNSFAARAGAMAVVTCEDTVGRILSIAGLTEPLDVFYDLDDAAAYLKLLT
jgi:anti-sigma B factor antagonist